MTIPKPSKLEALFIRQFLEDHAKFTRAMKEFTNGHHLSQDLKAFASTSFNHLRREIQWDLPNSLSRVDFGWRRVRLAIEIQGGVFGETKRSRRGHASRQGIIRDYSKFNALQAAGWTILLLHPEDLTKTWKQTLSTIAVHLQLRIAHAQLLQEHAALQQRR